MILSFFLFAQVQCHSLTHTQIHLLQSDHKMIKGGRSDPFHIHSLVFAIKQNDIDVLETLVNDRADPFSPNYRKWLPVDEVHKMTANQEGYDHVIQWLQSNNIPTESAASYTNYITASAPIAQWESLLDIQFYEWQHRNSADDELVTVHRSEVLNLPTTIVGHVSTVFNTCQAMPVIRHNSQMRSADGTPLSKTHLIAGDVPTHLRSRLSRQLTTSASVTVQYLNEYYQIPSNQGSTSLTQSVFETASQYFSASDLSAFQTNFSLPQEQPNSIHGFNETKCTSFDSCGEGNLDTQYIMGIAQHTSTIYWYLPDGSYSHDPFVAYLVDIEKQAFVSQSNSMSWDGHEYVSGVYGVCIYVLSSLLLCIFNHVYMLAVYSAQLLVSSSHSC